MLETAAEKMARESKMNAIIECADCGKLIRFGDSYWVPEDNVRICSECNVTNNE